MLSKTNWTAKREAAVAGARNLSSATPIHSDSMTHCLVEAMPKDGILVNEGITSARLANTLFAFRDRYAMHGNAAGGIGWALPAAIGVQMAQPNRPITCLSRRLGDLFGSGALDRGEPGVADHLCHLQQRRLPHHQAAAESLYGNDHYIDIDFQDPSSTGGLTRSMGMNAVRVTEPNELVDVLKTAYRRRTGRR